MNWKELKQFCNSLNDEQLEKKVILWREDEAITDIYAEPLDDDQYMGEDDEGCYPLSSVDAKLEDVERLGLTKVYDANTPILFENF